MKNAGCVWPSHWGQALRLALPTCLKTEKAVPYPQRDCGE